MFFLRRDYVFVSFNSSNILTVGTYNVAGIRKNYTKINFLYEAFKSIDIFALQETHFRDDAVASLFTQVFSAQFKLYTPTVIRRLMQALY